MAKLKEGKEEGLRMIFDHYYKYLLVIASQYTPDIEKAKDVVQEVFFELWKNRWTLHIKVSLKAYLRKAVVNRSLNQIKADKKFQLGDEHIDWQMEDVNISPDQRLEAKDLQTIINQTIDALPERCRLVFKLSRLEHLSHKEIAAQLNISTKTIENQMTKALKFIRKAVAQYGIHLLFIIFFNSFFLHIGENAF